MEGEPVNAFFFRYPFRRSSFLLLFTHSLHELRAVLLLSDKVSHPTNFLKERVGSDAVPDPHSTNRPSLSLFPPQQYDLFSVFDTTQALFLHSVSPQLKHDFDHPSGPGSLDLGELRGILDISLQFETPQPTRRIRRDACVSLRVFLLLHEETLVLVPLKPLFLSSQGTIRPPFYEPVKAARSKVHDRSSCLKEGGGEGRTRSTGKSPRMETAQAGKGSPLCWFYSECSVGPSVFVFPVGFGFEARSRERKVTGPKTRIRLHSTLFLDRLFFLDDDLFVD